MDRRKEEQQILFINVDSGLCRLKRHGSTAKACTGSKILLRVHSASNTIRHEIAKLDAPWTSGVFLGLKLSTAEIIIATEESVSVKVVEPRESTNLEETVGTTGDARTDMVEQMAHAGRKKSRQLNIMYSDEEEFGYTTDWPTCEAK